MQLRLLPEKEVEHGDSMRIAHVTPYFTPHTGGTETLVAEVAKWQARMGHNVSVVTSQSPRNALPTETTEDGVIISRLKTIEVFERPICRGLTSCLDAQERPDIVNLWTPFPLTDILSRRYAEKYDIPFVTTYVMDALMETLVGSRALGRLATQVYNNYQIRHVALKSDLVVTLNQSYYRKSPYLSNVPNERVRVSLQGTDTRRFHPFQGNYEGLLDIKDKQGVVFLSLGRLVPYKGICYLIRAFEQVCRMHKNVYLAVAGKGELGASLRSLVHKLSLDDKVRFLGFVPDESLPSLLNTADVVVSSAINDLENVPIAILDGMACGKPVVATDVGGARDQVENEVVGLLIEPQNISALSSAMSRLLNNKEERDAFGRAARRYAETISWEEIARGTLSIYAEAIKHRSSC